MFEYDNDGHYLCMRRSVFPRHSTPTFSLDFAIAWSPPFQGIRPPSHASRLSPDDPDGMSAEAQDALANERIHYESLRLWERYLAKPKYQIEFKMEEGELVLFDNLRVLHARKAFRDWTPEEREAQNLPVPVKGEPSRWLKGCYIDGDVVWDRLYASSRFKALRSGEGSENSP